MLCCNNSDDNVCCCCIPIGNRGGEKNTNNNINPINVEGGGKETMFSPKQIKNIRSYYHMNDKSVFKEDN